MECSATSHKSTPPRSAWAAENWDARQKVWCCKPVPYVRVLKHKTKDLEYQKSPKMFLSVCLDGLFRTYFIHPSVFGKSQGTQVKAVHVSNVILAGNPSTLTAYSFNLRLSFQWSSGSPNPDQLGFRWWVSPRKRFMPFTWGNGIETCLLRPGQLPTSLGTTEEGVVLWAGAIDGLMLARHMFIFHKVKDWKKFIPRNENKGCIPGFMWFVAGWERGMRLAKGFLVCLRTADWPAKDCTEQAEQWVLS